MRAMRKLVLLAVALLLPSLASAAGPSPRLIAKIRLGVGPCAGVAGFGSFWETSYGTATLSRINPRTNRVTRTGRLGFQPCGIAVGAGSIWIDGYGTAKVERVNPKTLRVVKRIRVGIAVWDVAYAFGSVWATNNAAGSVSRIDPATNRVDSRDGAGGVVRGPDGAERVRDIPHGDAHADPLHDSQGLWVDALDLGGAG